MEPLRFEPILKRIRWGGRRLGTLLNKRIGSESDYAESWEISDHGSGQSQVATGTYAGWSLNRLVQERGTELFGTAEPRPQFPLLIKYLDCNDRLSVQVHPDDLLAQRFQADENGKTEAWVVMDARPGSLIYAGFREEITPNEVEQALSAGTLESLLHRIEPQVGDCYFIPAGTVHALGEGVVVAEVQQSSDLTFRLYDWGRVDQQGQPRPLHIPEALQCINYAQGPVSAVVPQMLTDNATEREELLVSCAYFRLFRRQVKACLPLLPSGTCRVLMVLSGSGELRWEGQRAPLSMGESCLLPAASPLLELSPNPHSPWELLLAEVI